MRYFIARFRRAPILDACMIERQEIEQKAAQFEINTANVQRDYVLGWFLFALFSVSELRHLLFLKGGNALRKSYFENTRFSHDLDLGMESDVDPEFLRTEINNICDIVHTATGIAFKNEANIVKEKFRAVVPEDSRNQLRVYEVRIYFRDFYSNADHLTIRVVMDITRYDKIYLPLQDRPLIHPYSDYKELQVSIKCVKLEEIVATKLKCLLQREHPPDLFDYVYTVFFSRAIALDKTEVVSTFLRKTIFEPSPDVVKNILLELPFQFFKEYWHKNIVCIKQTMFDVELAIQNFKSSIEEIFGAYPDGGYYDLAFFPAKLRNPIMQAGRDRTLLKMMYQNSERLIEPYSLKYKEAKARSAREYLYAFDTSGGNSGTKCIKTFVAENVQSIVNTDIEFTPRVEIELAKAGEPVSDQSFRDPNRIPQYKEPRVRVRKSRSARSSSGYYGLKYQFRCPACNKSITKHTMDSTIGKHKNRYGGECYSRYGHYEGTKS